MESTSWNKYENNHECICCKFKYHEYIKSTSTCFVQQDYVIYTGIIYILYLIDCSASQCKMTHEKNELSNSQDKMSMTSNIKECYSKDFQCNGILQAMGMKPRIKMIAHPFLTCNVWSMSQVEPRGKRIWTREGFN